jgi:hypothetical protein
MTSEENVIAVRGRSIRVPSVQVQGQTIIITGTLFRVARIFDEEFVPYEAMPVPDAIISSLPQGHVQADVFTFGQRPWEPTPEYPYFFEWDNAAVAPTASFEEWWNSLPQEARKNVRRAAKRDVSVRIAKFDEVFVRGIKSIYDEVPVRQGRRFWHFGKKLETVEFENSSYLQRSEFLGAYYRDELVGFMKWVYVDDAAVMMQILSKAAHYDKRVMNALIAKAVEVCSEKGMRYLVYSKFTFGKKLSSSIADFKRRNGFVQIDFPQYYVPLTLKGRLGLRLKLHRQPLELLPTPLINVFLAARARLLNRTHRQHGGQAGVSLGESHSARAGDEPHDGS